MWWRSVACGAVGVTYAPCQVDDPVAALDPNVTCSVSDSRASFTVFARSDESVGGVPMADKFGRARELLLAGEQYAVEAALWAAMIADVATTVTAGATLVDAVALAEVSITAAYGGTPVLHMDRQAATRAHDVLHAEGARLKTLLGSSVVAGGGYGRWNSVTGVGLIIATGALVAQRSEMFDLGQTINRDTNSVDAVVERSYSIGWDCSAIKIQYDLIA